MTAAFFILQKAIERRSQHRLVLVAPERIGKAKRLAITNHTARHGRLACIEALSTAASTPFQHQSAGFRRFDDINGRQFDLRQ